jgi:hypothetical protein
MRNVYVVLIFLGLLSGCASRPLEGFSWTGDANASPEANTYLSHLAEKTYPIWKKIVTTKYQDKFEFVRKENRIFECSVSFSLGEDGAIRNAVALNKQEKFVCDSALEALTTAAPFPLPPGGIRESLAQKAIIKVVINFSWNASRQ